MIALLSKPRDEIDISDIQDLIGSQVPENENIEFKAALKTKGDGSPDSWMSGQGSIGDRAKNEILEEAVAFANAQGGIVLLGIKESESQPPVAADISPIPRCAELVERLCRIFDDCVEPRLPSIEIFAIPTKSEKGIIIIRTSRSRLAPHRVTTTRVCPIRRADECKPMTMWEIQDMTRNVSSHSPVHLEDEQHLEKQLLERSTHFQEEEFKHLETPEDAFGLRMTAVPIKDEVQFDHVFHGNNIIHEYVEPWRKVFREHDSNDHGLWDALIYSEYWEPRLSAARSERGNLSDGSSYYPAISIPRHHSSKILWNSYRELHCNGLLELSFIFVRENPEGKPTPFHPNMPIVMFANLLIWADRVRRQANAPTAEYGLEVEICVKGGPVSVKKGYYGSLLDEDIEKGKLSPGSKKFPKYILSKRDKILELIGSFHRDFWHSLGKGVGPAEPAFRIEGWPA